MGVPQGMGNKSTVTRSPYVFLTAAFESPGDIAVAPEAAVDAEVAKPAVEVVSIDVYHRGEFAIFCFDDLYSVDDGGLVVLVERISAELNLLLLFPPVEITDQGVVNRYRASAHLRFWCSEGLVIGILLRHAERALSKVDIFPGQAEHFASSEATLE